MIGAGPGDPGLLTLRGAECLSLCDVVLYDVLTTALTGLPGNPQIILPPSVTAARIGLPGRIGNL